MADFYEILAERVKEAKIHLDRVTINDRFVCEGIYPDGPKLYAQGTAYQNGITRLILPPSDFGANPWGTPEVLLPTGNTGYLPFTKYAAGCTLTPEEKIIVNNVLHDPGCIVLGFCEVFLGRPCPSEMDSDYQSFLDFLDKYFFNKCQDNELPKSVAIKKGFKAIFYELPEFKGCKQEFFGPCIINGNEYPGYKNYEIHPLFTGSLKVFKNVDI